MTLYEIKEKLAELGAAIKVDAEWIAAKAADPTVEIKALEEKQSHRDELKKRFDMLKAQEAAMEAEEKAKLKPVEPESKDGTVSKKAEFIRDVISGAVKKDYQGLGSIPANSADYGYGSRLLPTNMSRQLLTEPFEENSLRERVRITNIVNLVEPKLGFSFGDGSLDDVLDLESAREIELSGDSITYSRFQTRIKARVSNSLLRGADVDLVGSVENALRGGLALKEKRRAFATVSDGTHDHMSFYLSGIKSVAGDSTVKSIINAIADIPTAYRNIAVYMRRQDYYAALEELNGGDALYGRKLEEIIGAPVVFNDAAITPVVGDFSYYGINYDEASFDSEKNIDKGEWLFVLETVGDQRIRMKSAFRLAYVRVMVIGASVEASNTGAAGDTITVSAITTNNGSTPVSGITYQWQKYNAGAWEDLTSSYTGYHGATLTTKSTDAGASFRCVVTFTDTDGVSTAASNVVTLAGA